MNFIELEFKKWKQFPAFYLPNELINMIMIKDKISIDEFQNAINIFTKSKYFRVLRNNKVIFTKEINIPDGLIMCNFCGLIWDGCAQCPCWVNLDENLYPSITHN
jgi:hypothetical protein